MVDAEFEQIWQQLTHEASHEENPEEALKEIEAERTTIAASPSVASVSVSCSEIGQANGVVVTAQEMEMLIRQAAQQYREQDRQRFVEYIRSEPLAAAQLRAPLYEDKVVDFLFDKAEVAEREVTRDELQAAIEADENGEAPAKAEGEEAAAPKKKATRKKAAAEEARLVKPVKRPRKPRPRRRRRARPLPPRNLLPRIAAAPSRVKRGRSGRIAPFMWLPPRTSAESGCQPPIDGPYRKEGGGDGRYRLGNEIGSMKDLALSPLNIASRHAT
jgi:trigger factor